MKVNNTELDYYVDYINKKIHLLDMERDTSKSLANIISPDFQNKLIEQEGLLQDILDFDWVCYCYDGIIASYRNYNFKLVNPKLPYLHRPYKLTMESRKKRN